MFWDHGLFGGVVVASSIERMKVGASKAQWTSLEG
jgi:hypothetical protein